MADRLISADALKTTVDLDCLCPARCYDEESYLAGVWDVLACVDAAPAIEAIPLEWIEKQKAECYPRSLPWIALEALLRTWKEEKDEVEECLKHID